MVEKKVMDTYFKRSAGKKISKTTDVVITANKFFCAEKIHPVWMKRKVKGPVLLPALYLLTH